MTDFFKGIPKITYEGPSSTNEFAFQHYNPDEVILGKRMEDHMRFARSGVSGELVVTDTRFDLQLKLGFLLGAYSAKIEEKIKSNLDELLGPSPQA